MKKYTKFLGIILDQDRIPHHIAERLAVPVSVIRKHFIDEMGMIEYLKGWGRVDRQKDLLSRRRATARSWPVKDQQVIEEHKKLHDAGLVSLCHGRDGDFILLYAQQNDAPITGRRPYFQEL